MIVAWLKKQNAWSSACCADGALKGEWLGLLAWDLQVVRVQGELFDHGFWVNKPVAQLVLRSSSSWHGARCVTCAVCIFFSNLSPIDACFRSGLVCSSSVWVLWWEQYDGTFEVSYALYDADTGRGGF